MNRIARTLGALGVLSALACGGDATVETAESDVETGGGESLAQYEGPVTGDATAGAEVFATNCAGCHPGVGPDLQSHGASPAEARHIIRVGEDRMPAFGPEQLSDADVENVLAHMQAQFGMFAN
jgi:mono/diheme cytochrome c family protein